MFTYVFKNKCDINELLDTKLKDNQKGFYSCHDHYQDIVIIYALSKKHALKKVSKMTTIEPDYELYRLESPLRHHLSNLISKLIGDFEMSDTLWLTDY